MPIYLWSQGRVVKRCLCSERLVHVHYVAIDDLVITTPLKNDITTLWRCSGKAGASLLGQDVVASLMSLCMAKWLCKWRRGWLYVRSNTKNAKSLLTCYDIRKNETGFAKLSFDHHSKECPVSTKKRECTRSAGRAYLVFLDSQVSLLETLTS